jgi:hypothetical protein
MFKRIEKLHRLVSELSERYGSDDEHVLLLRTELTELKALNLKFPSKARYWPNCCNFLTPAKRLYKDADGEHRRMGM